MKGLMGILESPKNKSEFLEKSLKSPGNLFLKMGTNPGLNILI